MADKIEKPVIPEKPEGKLVIQVKPIQLNAKQEASRAKVEEIKKKAGAVTLNDVMDMLLIIYEKLDQK